MTDMSVMANSWLGMKKYKNTAYISLTIFHGLISLRSVSDALESERNGQ